VRVALAVIGKCAGDELFSLSEGKPLATLQHAIKFSFFLGNLGQHASTVQLIQFTTLTRWNPFACAGQPTAQDHTTRFLKVPESLTNCR
jgi:hypothetical protein